MASLKLSRQSRILILLAIDTAFFILELTVGILVHSLALYADAMHMLNDILSLFVALYAIKLASQTEVKNARLSFGWQRAEVLGALINGVFLLAVCFSIFLEAIQRFIDPPVVTNPVLILIVGSAGLASNIVGLFLFHDHSHGHGGHSHSHGDEEAGEADGENNMPGNDIESILPETTVRRQWNSRIQSGSDGLGSGQRHPNNSFSHRSTSSADYESFVHPATTRRHIVEEAEAARAENNSRARRRDSSSVAVDDEPTETTPMAQDVNRYTHHEHNHNRPMNSETGHGHGGGGGGHSHANLNMRGVFLHVLGDAVGNVGVMMTALFIWKTDFSWKYYADPVISLVIVTIICSSALPLVRSASYILLQAAPPGVDIEEVKEDILSLDGVDSLHELHIWQLSDSKLVASLHINVTCQEGTKEYMKLAREIQHCLHEYGIHSSTIQPEFTDSAGGNGAEDSNGQSAFVCKMGCVQNNCAMGRCCPPSSQNENASAEHNH